MALTTDKPTKFPNGVMAKLVDEAGNDVTPAGPAPTPGAAIPDLTDNSTGTASGTIAAISDAPTKNAIASLAAKQNLILAALRNIGAIGA